jgi:predicted Zn-dependent protease
MAKNSSLTKNTSQANVPLFRRKKSLLAILTAAVAVLSGLSIYISSAHFGGSLPAQSQLLRASDDVNLTTPPELPESDIKSIEAALTPMEPLQSALSSHLRDRRFLESFAHRAIAANDLLSSFAAYRALVDLCPEELAFQDLLGQVENKLALYSRAGSIFRKLASQRPDNVNGHIGLAQSVYGMGSREETIRILEGTAKSLRQNDPMGRLFIAKELEKLIDYPEAALEAKKAWESMPSEPVAAILYARLLYKLRQLTEAQTILSKVVAEHPENVPARSTLAQILENPLNPKRNLQEAENHYLEALNRDRTDSGDCRSLGLLYMEEGRYKQAAFIFILLLRAQPDSATGRLQLGKAFSRLGNPASGAEQGKIASKLILRDTRENELSARRGEHPTNPSDRLNLARHYMDYGQFGKALPELQAACVLAPQSEKVRQMLTEFDARVGVHQRDFALKVAQ